LRRRDILKQGGTESRDAGVLVILSDSYEYLYGKSPTFSR
jgi:hypothetical protein